MPPRFSLPHLFDRLAVRPWHLILIASGCAVVVALFMASFWQTAASLQALGSLQAQAVRLQRQDSLLIQLAEAESSVRGYLLSRNRAYLEPYEAGLATIGYTLDDIRADLAPRQENEEILAELSGLVTLKLRILADAVQRGTVGEEAPPGAGAEGKRYMDRLRALLSQIRARELAAGEHSLARSRIHFYQIGGAAGALAAAALALLLALHFVQKRQQALQEEIARLLASENQRLDALVGERTAELTELASYLTQAREAEQAHIARELHDELGAFLTVARMDAATLVRDWPSDRPGSERCERLLATLDGGIALKRRLIDALRPPLLAELGLVAALRGLGEDFAAGGRGEIALELPDADPSLSPEAALALYRIAQEGLTNIRKHAAAKHIQLALREAGERLLLELADDGSGFDPTQMGQRRHGLAGMKHRVQMCGGEFTLSSRPGNGTRIAVAVPLARAIPPPARGG